MGLLDKEIAVYMEHRERLEAEHPLEWASYTTANSSAFTIRLMKPPKPTWSASWQASV